MNLLVSATWVVVPFELLCIVFFCMSTIGGPPQVECYFAEI